MYRLKSPEAGRFAAVTSVATGFVIRFMNSSNKVLSIENGCRINSSLSTFESP
jgi:hypothetical protein